MECKVERLSNKTICLPGINRNIVECKVYPVVHSLFADLSINRNIVECKDNKRCVLVSSCFVLIETLWNVKS